MDSSKERYERRCNGVYLYHYTYNFFHNNRPGKPLPGHSSFLGLFGALFFMGGEGWREGRTDCRRGGCMVVPGAVVSPAVRPVRWRETKRMHYKEILESY